MSTTDQTNAPASAGPLSSEELGPRCVECGGPVQWRCPECAIRSTRDLLTREEADARVAAERERWQELVDHLRHCRECGETDVAHCHEGAALWKQATGDDLRA